MKLYATADCNTTTAKRLEVYDNNGLAHIIKTLPNGTIMEWTSSDRTPAWWVENNTGRKWKWVMA